MLSRDKLEYQKRLRFLREAKAKTASEELKLAKKAEESDLTKRMVTLGDEKNRVPVRGETPKASNEVPKTRETSRVKDPIEAGDKGDNALHLDLDDLDYAKISEQKRFYVKRVGAHDNEPYSGEEMDTLGIEPQFYSDENEAGTVADLLIDLDPHGMEDFYVADMEDEPVEPEDDKEFLKEASPPQQDADQSLARMKKRKKATRTKSMKRKSHAKLNESNLEALLRECGCEMESPFDAPEDEPQGYMLKQSLEKIGSQATDLSNVANHDDDPEPWVEFKVTSAAEQIDAVHDYIKYGRKHRSDMSGHEDMHSHNEMMNENKLSLKTILEQDDGPTEFDYAMGMGATGFASPDAIVPPAPTAAPTVSAPTAARRGRRAPVTDAIQACNLIFNEQTPRSFAMHLKRLKRGLEANDATIADYELRANSTHIAFANNRYMPVILAANSSLSSQLDTVKNAIREFNTPALPQQLSQITNRRAVISKITTLQNVLASNANICDSLRNPPPAPATPPPTTPEREPALSPEEQTRLNNANRALTQAQQAISEYINSIVRGEVDLSDTRNRPAYFERLNQLVSAYNNAMLEVQRLNASRGTEVLDRSVENYIRHIDNVLNQLNSNPNAVRMYFENHVALGKSLKRLIERVPAAQTLFNEQGTIPAPPPIATPAEPIVPAGAEIGLNAATLLGVPAAAAAGYGLGTGINYAVGGLTGRGTDVAELGGVPIGLAIRPDTSVDPNNIRFAATAATRVLQNQKSALQSIRNALRTGGSAGFSGITNPYAGSRVPEFMLRLGAGTSSSGVA